MGSPFVGYGKTSQYKKIVVIIIPFKSTGYHWIFIQIDLRNRRYCIIDPLRENIDEHSKTCLKALFVIKYILQNKFGLKLKSFILEKIDHLLQNDSISCGFLVYYYGKKIYTK